MMPAVIRRSGDTGTEAAMTINFVTITPLVALIAGILILIAPRILNYVIAIYLIIVGVTGLWPHFAG